MRISCHHEEKVSVLSPVSLARRLKLPPITSVSLTSMLTKVFISLRSINYHPISYSHSGTAAILHSVKSVHLVNLDTFMFAVFS